MADTNYRTLIESLDPDKIYVQTCTAHGKPLLYGPFDSHDEANAEDYTYCDRGVHNPPPREVLRGCEIDPARHGEIITSYLAGELPE
ncbi:MAG: hypothetical protein MN733_25875 [Nitrososphaera sp.]|nr:hypothetical protein [Nitrososphaera sp.]